MATADQNDSQIGAKVPTNLKSALEKAAWAKSTPHERTTVSDLVRDSIELWLFVHQDELPEEALDDLDGDLKANAGVDVNELIENLDVDVPDVEEGAA